jgi:hypothetical protein
VKKPFCDICGEPAIEDLRPVVIEKMGAPWSGYRTSRDGSGCDGNWQPQVRASVVLEVVNHKKLPDNATPDLCAKCARGFMQKLVDLIPTPDRLSVAITEQH